MFGIYLAIVIFFGAAISVAPAFAEKRVALVMGNAAYTQISRLQKSVNDAQKMAEILRGMKFEVILAIDVKANELRALASNFQAALKGADVGVVFYSGHGFQTNRAEQQHPINHIVPVDFSIQEANILASTLALDTLIDVLRRNARVGFIFMDACRSDPQLSDASQLLMSASKGVTMARGFSPVSVSETPSAENKTRASKGPAGLLIAYATDPGNVALEVENAKYSPFTGSLIKHLGSPGLSAAEVMGRVSAEVSAETQGLQTPWSVSSLTAGTYKFVAALPAAPVKPSSAAPLAEKAPRTGGAPPQPSRLPPGLGGGVGAGG